MIKKSNIRCLVTMSKDFNNKLKKIAAKENRSVSNLVVTILKEYVAEKEKSLH